MRILGVSAYYHDAAACLVEDGNIVAAAQEERFTRVRHDASFPGNAVRYCLAQGGVARDGLDAVAFYDKPLLKFHRILETYLGVAPRGLRSYLSAIPLWAREKLWIPPLIEEALARAGVDAPEKLYFPEHHESHAASAFYPSPFEEAAVLTLDGVGEWSTSTLGVGVGARLELLEELRFPHSLGLLYSAFTYFCGFKVNSGEYKLMGLAPYGEPSYAQRIFDELLDLKEDGSFRLDLSYFGFLDELVMTSGKFDALFDGPRRKPESRIGKRERDLARSIQAVLEEVLLRIARHARARTGKRDLCLAGGVALNCVANGRLLREGIFDRLFIQPAAGDAGGAVGAALAVFHNALGNARSPAPGDGMSGAFLGPSFSEEEIRAFLDARGFPYTRLADDAWADTIAGKLAEGRIVGLLQGRMEFGPRSLGNRSILGDPRSPRMQSVLNLKVKNRESFRPFAPAVLAERAADYFDLSCESPYMLLVAPLRKERLLDDPTPRKDPDDLVEWVNRSRSELPAITHVDGSARIQTVTSATNPGFHALLSAFDRKTGCAVLVNTSFNVRGEPIVCTPEDAYRCFMRTEIDDLVLGPFLLQKGAQPPWTETERWRERFTLD